jgi:DNA-directed RNA polymerase specialized sigma24 family protein
MVANKESQREVAKELGISRKTLRDRKDNAMKELGEKLKEYK